MTKDEALDLALDALESERDKYLEWGDEDGAPDDVYEAITAIKQARLATVQEPVAVCHDDGYWTPLKTEAGRRFNDLLSKAGSRINVYTAPPAAQREWVGLTEWEVIEMKAAIAGTLDVQFINFARAIEAKVREKNAATQPAVPDALFRHAPEHPQYIEGWNDCRAEMLKGMK
jgi:hypothetical protein